ncbi:MAG TPA: PQQ-binding-like beta-propeller repeat protein [Solirubrobacterales bacterium]|nr:PQQ-binding-like beta-propeller repeat protein [Solirubrobacterales bacterium]
MPRPVSRRVAFLSPCEGKATVILIVLLVLSLAGCGSGTSGSPGGSGSSSGGYIDWPQFGRVPERTHYLAEDRRALDPPLREAWSINTHALIEFPPAIHDGVAYVINKYGNGKAVRLRDRKVLWEIDIRPSDKGKPNFVTAPTYYGGAIYGAFLDGHLAAGDAATGKKLWVRKLHAHLESSPLAVDGLLYLGTDTTNLLALDAKTGRTVWSFNSPGAIKSSPSYHAGRVFAADYQSSVYALNAKTGKPVWRTNTSKVPPYGRGGFFSSPAVAFGCVYAARDDGTVFALDERTGKVEWSFPTGDSVYGSPAVARVPGTPPTVYIGSENGRFFALDARTGKPRWTYDVRGAIPGTATVIGHTVYTTSFVTRETTGLDTRTGKRVFHIKQAGYTPMVSDGKRLYLVSYYALIGLEPAKR